MEFVRADVAWRDHRDQFLSGVKTTLPGYDVLGILQSEFSCEDFLFRGLGQPGQVFLDAFDGLGIGGPMGFEQVFGLFLELIKIGTGSEWCGHTYLLSGASPDIRMYRQKEGGYVFSRRWAQPFPRTCGSL